jgi:hypothetical protein
MATTGAVLRHRLSELVEWEGWAELTTSAAGLGNGTTLVDTSLVTLPGGSDDDFCEGWYVLITSGAAASSSPGRVTAYVASTRVITVAPAFTAQIAASVTYELHQYHPTQKRQCLNTAGRKVFAHGIYLPVYDETLVTDQLGQNMDFETYTSTPGVPDNWTADANTTMTKETSRIFHGLNSTRLVVASGTTDVGFYQDLILNVADIVGRSLTFGGFMWSRTADSGWFQIDFGSGDTYDSTKHAGDEDWQEASVTVSIPSTASQIRIRCIAEATDNPETYFDSLYCSLSSRIDRYIIPSTFVIGPWDVQLQIDRKIPAERHYHRLKNWWIEEAGETRYLFLGEDVPCGYRLRLNGGNVVTLPSSDTTSMEVEDTRIDAIVEYAAAEMFSRLADAAPGLDAGDLETRAIRHLDKALFLLRQDGVRMHRPQAMRTRVHSI